jgi:hypothetical protein
MLVIMTGIPQAWGSMLSYSNISKLKLFNFIENQFNNTISGEKWHS